MTKIAFDAQLFLKGNKTGIAWCADNLIKNLAQTKEYECQLDFFSKGYSEDKLQIMKEYQNLGITLRECKWFNDVWYKLVWPFLRIPYHWFFGSDNQITQFFNYVIPPGVKGKKVTIVHDMAHLACPETVRLKTKRWLDLTLEQSCRRADAIITVSEFSKQELIKYLHVPEEKIYVMYNGIDFDLYRPDYSEKQVNEVRERYHIEKDYFLYLGTIEPRKNLTRLLKAYGKLAKTNLDVPQLVLAGGKGWLCDEIYLTAEQLQLGNKILFTGYVGKQEGPILMKGARAFLFPSIYEGFGMPAVEALACGTPVLAANAASLPEVLGECAMYVDPLSVDDIARGLKKMLTDSDDIEAFKAEGLEYAKRYSWENSVKAIRGVYDKL